MKAMILAAGQGTRVRPLTYTIPKPMIPIMGKPVMEYLVELLKQHQFDQIMVNVSHLAHEIENYFRDGQRFGVEISYSFEGAIELDGNFLGKALGSAGGMRKIQDFHPFFDETFVVLCGDALIDLNLSEVVEWHKKKGAMATIVMQSIDPKDVSSYGVVVTDTEGRVKSFQEKPTPEEALSHNINTGIYIFEPEVLELIPSDQEFDIGSQLFPKLVQMNAPLFAKTMEFQWIDIGKVPDYLKAISSVLKGKVNNINIPGKEVLPDVFTGLNVSMNLDRVNLQGPIYIGGMTKVEDGAEIIGPTVIGANCFIGADAHVERSVIFKYSSLGAGLSLIDKLLFGHYCIDSLGNSIDLRTAELNWLICDSRQPFQQEPESLKEMLEMQL